MTVVELVSVASGSLLSRVTLGDDGTITYEGGPSARSAVMRQMRATGASETDAIRALRADGWSNGYAMVKRD
ncbi:hypothetical protein ACIBG7_15175 [Nonomuraea sp. NPDC050328]|uniref:hypothetical protein n=1 Tax=Nonomuraea sp. NPDC050328 TaxID=3364361 RepID=UPI0037A17C9B